MMQPHSELDPKTSLKVTRTIRASAERVFDAFVVPELRRQWWAVQPGDRCTVCEIDGRVGGDYRINMITGNGEFTMTGTFREFVRPKKLVFTWSWPTEEVRDTLVTILFEPSGKNVTFLTIIHSGFSTPEYRDMHSEGWTGCAGTLAAFLESAG